MSCPWRLMRPLEASPHPQSPEGPLIKRVAWRSSRINQSVPRNPSMAHSGFWETMSILVDKDWKKLAVEDIQEWLDRTLAKRQAYVIKDDDDVSVIGRKRRLSEYSECEIGGDEDIKKFLKALKLPKIECKFSHPQTRSRLEKLMGSNLVSLTDRNYMQKLQERILEDFEESMDKRIKARENEEMERVKNLVLIGKIPKSQAPPEMAQHPVMLIETHCNKLIAEKRAKIKIRKVKVPTYLYWDDTPDPPSGLSIERGHVFRKPGERLCIPYEEYIPTNLEEPMEDNEYMLTEEDFDRFKYEDPDVKELMNCETVDAMYSLAEEIIGNLRTIDGGKHADTLSTMTG